MTIASQERSLVGISVRQSPSATGAQSASASARSGIDVLVSRHDLGWLTARAAGQPHVSLFFPISPRGPQSAQNPIRWKNLLARAEAALRDIADPGQVAATVATVRQFAADQPVTQARSYGLAVFARPDWSRSFRLPAEFPELAAVGDRFLTAPLMEFVSPDHRFLLLMLNQARIRLFAGTRFALDEIAADQLPSGPASPSAARSRGVMDRPDAFLAGPHGSRTGVVYYGRGSVEQQRREETLRYFRTVDAMLPGLAGRDRPPLLLAGVGHLIPLYRQVSRYPYLVDDALATDPSQLSIEALHDKAWAVVEPQFRHDELAAAKRFRDLAGTGWTLSEPGEVLTAARAGRIEVLFVAESIFTRPTSNEPPVLRLAGGTGSVADQLDQATAECLAYGGAVYLVPADHMPDPNAPGGSPAAALLRF